MDDTTQRLQELLSKAKHNDDGTVTVPAELFHIVARELFGITVWRAQREHDAVRNMMREQAELEMKANMQKMERRG